MKFDIFYLNMYHLAKSMISIVYDIYQVRMVGMGRPSLR